MQLLSDCYDKEFWSFLGFLELFSHAFPFSGAEIQCTYVQFYEILLQEKFLTKIFSIQFPF